MQRKGGDSRTLERTFELVGSGGDVNELVIINIIVATLV